MQNISQNTFEAARNMKHICIENQPITINNPDSGPEVCNKNSDFPKTLRHVTSVYGHMLTKVWSLNYENEIQYAKINVFHIYTISGHCYSLE